MRLYEEYFRRHNIQGFPLVHHCTRGTLLLRTKNPDKARRWVIMSIRWAEHSQHPGSYVIEFILPIHDGYGKGGLFAKLSPVSKQWDEYEDYLLEWSSQLKDLTPVRGRKNITLAAWEVFVYCYDGWFRKQTHALKEMLFRSLDEESCPEERFGALQQILDHLTTNQPAVLRTWKYEVEMQVQGYADWLATLVEARVGK